MRESFAYDGEVGGEEFFLYTATDSRCQIDSYEPVKWTPSIYMPRRASRIDLEITGVRVEKLQSISEDDARSEGIPNGAYAVCPRKNYERLWESINGLGSWEKNPWVFCIEFRRARP